MMLVTRSIELYHPWSGLFFTFLIVSVYFDKYFAFRQVIMEEASKFWVKIMFSYEWSHGHPSQTCVWTVHYLKGYVGTSNTSTI